MLFREAVLAFMGVHQQEAGQQPKTGQALGAYCGSRYLDDCRSAFGDGLAAICATCPD